MATMVDFSLAEHTEFARYFEKASLPREWK
jgi:hypothetical protein